VHGSFRSLSLSERMVREAEKKIQARLRPLLQKAEVQHGLDNSSYSDHDL